ncbi:MAG: thioredoxin family protein [Paludibacteraceae bacterium]|nr:thioredoxin family protein [Paludibacteraceae bacterium]
MKKIILFFIFVFIGFTNAFSQIIEPIKWSFLQQEKGDSILELVFKATIDDGWHLYGTDLPEGGPVSTTIHFNNPENIDFIGDLISSSNEVVRFDETFQMELNWFDNEAIFIQKITNNRTFSTIDGYIEFMACNNQSCLPPTKVSFSFGEEEKFFLEREEKAYFPDYWEPVISELNAFGNAISHSSNEAWWIIFLKGFIGGLLAILTPCIWPIIPMTISFFLKRSKDNNKGRLDAVFYGFSIVFIYLLLGIVITLFFGASALNSLSTNAFFNLFFFVLLVVFAISFLGVFEITLPSSWSTKIDLKAEKTTGFVSILLMAFTLVLVSFSCTGPIIGTLLVDVSVNGSLIAPVVGMLGFSVALALPFSLFAFFPSFLNSLPKSGEWLNSVKVVLGFLELALALKFLSVADLAYGWHILDREVFLTLWIVIFSILGLYLLGKIHFSHEGEQRYVSVFRLFLAISSFAFAVYLVPGLWGAPLKSISAFAPPLYTQDFSLYKTKSHALFNDFDAGMSYAKSRNLPILVNFSGHGCVNCRKMEATVLTNEKVNEILTEKLVFITLFVDDKKNLDSPITIEENGKKRTLRTIGDRNSYLQRMKFGANAQPFYVLLDNEGKPLEKAFAFDENPQNFIEFLEEGLKNYNNKSDLFPKWN